MEIKTLKDYEIMALINSSWWNDVKEGLCFVEDTTTKTRKTSTALTERVSERGGERGSST